MLERKVVGMAPAVRLGILRALICAAALVSVVSEKWVSFSEISTAWYHPVGFLRWLPQGPVQTLLSSGPALLGFQGLLILFLLLSMAGVRTSFSLLLASALYFFYAGILRSYGTFFNQGFVVLYLLFLMVFLPSGAGFSLDDKWKRQKGMGPNMQPDEAMGGSVFLLRAVVAFSYWQAACAKLHDTGVSWLEPWNLKRFLIQENLNLMHFDSGFLVRAMHLPDAFWGGLAATVLLSELFFPLVLFWWEIRKFYPWLVAAVQGVLWLLCPALSLEVLTAWILLLIFYDWDRVFLKHHLPPEDRRGKPA